MWEERAPFYYIPGLPKNFPKRKRGLRFFIIEFC